MDWSLVLISQGIEPVIEPPQDGSGWALVVSAKDSERAFKSLRQYHTENRDWPWRQELPWPKTSFDWFAVAWAIMLMMVARISSADASIHEAGVMDTLKVSAGQWWRIVTAITLHADVAHLAENLSIGIVLLGLAMGRFGTGIGLLAALIAGIGGNGASLLLNQKPFIGLGASGMIMGALGLLAAPVLRRRNKLPVSYKTIIVGVAAGIMLFTLFGLSPGTDMAAHLGGFVCGLAIGIALVHCPERWNRSTKPDLAALMVFVAILTTCWRLAWVHRL